MATDSHNDEGRAPRISHCAQWLEKKIGREGMERLLNTRSRVLEDRPLERDI